MSFYGEHMHYFYLEGKRLTCGEEVELGGEDTLHAHRVLRLRAMEIVAVSDGAGQARKGLVLHSRPDKVRILLKELMPPAESTLKIILLQAMTRGEKMDLIIRQAVELGVSRVVPVFTERSIPRWNRQKVEKKIGRWKSIIRSASAQCRRARLPLLENVSDLNTALLEVENARAFIAWEKEMNRSLARVLQQPCPADKVVFFFVGPEGGFGDEEIEAAAEAGFKPVHLGQRVLRVETAATAGLAMIQAAWGDISYERENC